MKLTAIWMILIVLGISTGCAVMSKDVTRDALRERPFAEMVQQTEQYIGQTLILGGYIVSMENKNDGTRLVAVHAPLGAGQQPKSKDLSKGRLIITHDGFLDPEVYTKDRVITVGGTVSGSSKTDDSTLPYPYLRIQAREIHLWPVRDPMPIDPYWYYDCYPFHYSRWGHRYHPWCW